LSQQISRDNNRKQYLFNLHCFYNALNDLVSKEGSWLVSSLLEVKEKFMLHTICNDNVRFPLRLQAAVDVSLKMENENKIGIKKVWEDLNPVLDSRICSNFLDYYFSLFPPLKLELRKICNQNQLLFCSV